MANLKKLNSITPADNFEQVKKDLPFPVSDKFENTPPPAKQNIEDYRYPNGVYIYACKEVNGKRVFFDRSWLRFALDTQDKPLAAYYYNKIRYQDKIDDWELINSMKLYFGDNTLRTYFNFFNPPIDINVFYTLR